MLHTNNNDNFMKWLINGIELGIEIDKYITLDCDCGCIDLDNLLVECAYYKRYDLFKIILNLGASINAIDDYGRTPLIIFTKQDNLEMVKFCVENKCNIIKKDNTFMDAYSYAIGSCKEYLGKIIKN